MASLLHIRKKAHLTGHNASIFALAAGEESSIFYSAAGDGWIVRWDLNAPEVGRLVAKVDTQVFSLLFLADHHKMVAGNMNGGVHWIDLDRPDATRNIAHHQRGVYAAYRIGDFVYTAGGEGMLTRWSAAEGRALESLHLSSQSLRSLDYCPSRNEIAVGASDNSIYFLDAGTLTLRRTLANAHDNSVFAVRYSPDGQYLLSGGRDAHLRVWHLGEEATPVSAQPAHWFTINAIAFHPGGSWFATASRDKTVKIWDAATFELLKVLDTIRDGGHINSVNCLYWADYGNCLVSGSDDRSMVVWEVGNGHTGRQADV